MKLRYGTADTAMSNIRGAYGGGPRCSALTGCVTRHYVTRRHNHVLIEHVKRAPPKICLASLFLDVHHHGLDQYIFRMQSER